MGHCLRRLRPPRSGAPGARPRLKVKKTTFSLRFASGSTVYGPEMAVKGRKYRGGTPPRYYWKRLFNSISEAHSGESRHHQG